MKNDMHQYPVYGELRGKLALVTGGGSGIGKAIAQALLQQGCKVLVVQRSSTLSHQPDLHFIQCDLGEREQLRTLKEKIVAEFGAIDILINNAAGNYNGDLREVDLDAWDRLVHVNVTAPLRLASDLSGPMIERGWGRIINISSISVYDNTPFNMLYAATKSALNSFTKSWARQLAKSNITVNAITPGFTETRFTASLATLAKREGIGTLEAYEKTFRTHVPTRKATRPEDVAAAVLYLCSAGSANLTGDVVNICGGEYMNA